MRDKGVDMTLCDYEHEFIGQLVDNLKGGDWDLYVKECYEKYMASEVEKRIERWEIERL